jgi:putative DNA primase/helicase
MKHNAAPDLDDLDRQYEAEAVDLQLVFNPRDPLPTARRFVGLFYQREAGRTLFHHRGGFYAWDGSAYTEVAETELRARLYDMLGKAWRPVGKDKLEPFQPTASKVNDVMDALKAATHLAGDAAAPCWLDGRRTPAAAELLACDNGLLHLPTRKLLAATPAFFGLNAVGFGYDPVAPEPTAWLDFLDSIWRDDLEAIDTLQEIFGHLLTTDTRHQKMFLIVGPKRSGKGTIARVLKALLGNANVAGPTLSGLGTNFGLAPLIGKPLAIISDARLSGRADQHVIAERLLSISGEDHLTIDRKHREAWTGTLPTRFLVLTNELPRIADSSGALASRFIVLTLAESFFGREDHGLTDRLLGELPGILNWSLDGWERLRDRGRFQQPASSAEAIQELDDLGSPISVFVRERCIVAPGRSVQAQTLFDAWTTWCEAQGRDHPGTAQTFGRDLRAAVPGLKVTQPRSGEGARRPRTYEGIGLG